MRKKGFTLIEVILVILLSSILGLSMTSQFIANERFQRANQNNLSAVQEAQLAMNHVARFLRFAKPASFPYGSNLTDISFTVECNHLSAISSNRTARYQFDAPTNSLNFYFTDTSPSQQYLVSNAITDFSVSRNTGSNLCTIKLTATQGNATAAVETAVLMLGS